MSVNKIKSKPMDKPCIRLVKAINCIPGIYTTSSCSGHSKDKFEIYFIARRSFNIFPILRAINKSYCGWNCDWRVEVFSIDTPPYTEFILESNKIGRIAYYESNKVAESILKNLS